MGRVQTFKFSADGWERTDEHTSLADASRRLPHGAYTTLRTYGGRGVVRFAQHVARLNETAALLKISGPRLSEADARDAAKTALVTAAATPESRLRLTWAPPVLYVSVEEFEPPPETLYRQGVRCVTLRSQRDTPHAKDTRFIAEARAAHDALPSGVHEGLLVAEDGAILEGLSSNFFAVREGVLRTEEERALTGVTRSLVLELAGVLLPVERRAVARAELSLVSEAFLTSVSREILPIVEIDAAAVGTGQPGPHTAALRARFAELVARELDTL